MLLARVADAALRVTQLGVDTAQAGLDLVASVVGPPQGRRCWAGNGRTWIEVRGLNGQGGPRIAESVLAARGTPGGVGRVEPQLVVDRGLPEAAWSVAG
jgi:H+-transporting ATPase